jgi:hypothetical protein
MQLPRLGHLQQGKAVEVKLPVPNLAGQRISVATWAPGTIHEYKDSRRAVELQHVSVFAGRC